jgi:hypothetical protein
MTGTRYRPNGVRPKAAFLPNDLSKELERQAVCDRRGSTIWQMDNELAVAAVLLSAGASSLMPGVGGVGPAARLSGSLALSDSASCALAVAANAKQIEKITAKLPDVMVRPQHAGVGDRAACVSST